MSEYQHIPVRRFVTAAQNIATGFVKHKVSLVSHGLKTIKITASQNADPGVDHLIKFNDPTDSEEVPMVDGESLTITLSDTLPEKYSIRHIFIKAGKDATTFTILGAG